MDHKKDSYLAYAQVKSREMQFWGGEYRKRILRILQDKKIPLTLETIPEIINATSFRVLGSDSKYKSHCPYFRQDSPKSCHPEITDLNCFLCSCPNYDSQFIEITENSHQRILIGKCKADTKAAQYHFSPQFKGIGFWDCSNCSAYHNPKSVEKYLREHMKELEKQARIE